MIGCVYKTQNGGCGKPDRNIAFCIGSSCQYQTPNNADFIRSMSDYELADWLCKILTYCSNQHCNPDCPLFKCCNGQPTDNIEGWLKSPVRKEE